MKETELAEHVIAWIREKRPEWNIWTELKPGWYSGVADIVCVKEEQMNDCSDSEEVIWVIEVKTSLSLQVIRQAYKWDVDYRSVAVPRVKSKTAKKSRRFWYGYMSNQMNIGSLVISSHGVREARKASKHKITYNNQWGDKHKLLAMCGELTKGFSKAGSVSGGYWTPYAQTMKDVKKYIENNPYCTVKQIVEDCGKFHYASEKSARSTLTMRLQGLEKGWCETDRMQRPFRYSIRNNNE